VGAHELSEHTAERAKSWPGGETPVTGSTRPIGGPEM
jgi:hypothetical protein